MSFQLKFFCCYAREDQDMLDLLNFHPLKIWTKGIPPTYNTYLYPATYEEQSPGQLVYAVPPQNVILKPIPGNLGGESDQISIPVMSTVTAYLQFQIQVAYQIASNPQVHILTLPHLFNVVFSDASNWQEYFYQDGSFVRKP